eukprot:129223-Prymnesium_polylepis.1
MEAALPQSLVVAWLGGDLLGRHGRFDEGLARLRRAAQLATPLEAGPPARLACRVRFGAARLQYAAL